MNPVETLKQASEQLGSPTPLTQVLSDYEKLCEEANKALNEKHAKERNGRH